MKRKMLAGTTSVSLPVFVRDTSSATGGGLSGLVFNTGSLTAEYRRHGSAAWTAIALVTKTLGTWVSGGFVADGARAGYYELDVPNAALAAGVRWVAIRLYGATNMGDVAIEIELDAVNYQDAAAFGLTNLNATVSSRASQTSLDTVAGYVDTEIAAIKAKTDNLPTDPADQSILAGLIAAIIPGNVYRLLATPLRSGRSEAVRYTRGATGPDLLDHLLDGNGARLDLTGYTITASLIRIGTEVAVFTDEDAELGNAPEEGQVVLSWPAASLDDVGSYRLIWTATKTAADTLTWSTMVTVE